MANLNTQHVQFEALRSLVYTGTSSSYAALGTPLIYSARIISIVNQTNGDMIFSTDGTTDMLFVPQSSYKIYDFTANRLSVDGWFVVPPQTQFYVKRSSAPSSGSVYLEVIYGVDSVRYPGRLA